MCRKLSSSEKKMPFSLPLVSDSVMRRIMQGLSKRSEFANFHASCTPDDLPYVLLYAVQHGITFLQIVTWHLRHEDEDVVRGLIPYGDREVLFRLFVEEDMEALLEDIVPTLSTGVLAEGLSLALFMRRDRLSALITDDPLRSDMLFLLALQEKRVDIFAYLFASNAEKRSEYLALALILDVEEAVTVFRLRVGRDEPITSRFNPVLWNLVLHAHSNAGVSLNMRSIDTLCQCLPATQTRHLLSKRKRQREEE